MTELNLYITRSFKDLNLAMLENDFGQFRGPLKDAIQAKCKLNRSERDSAS